MRRYFNIGETCNPAITIRHDDFIPIDLVEPVAEVLKWVKSLNDAKKEEAELDSIEL